MTEALREATEYSRTLSSPEAFLVVMAELLADGFEVGCAGFASTDLSMFCCVCAGDPTVFFFAFLKYTGVGT